MAETQEQVEQIQEDTVDVQEAQIPEAADLPIGESSRSIDVLLDTEMPITVRLGKATLRVSELLQLSPGSVLKLEKNVGEPLDVYLQGNHFATGQLVVVGDQLGIRVKEILAPTMAGENADV